MATVKHGTLARSERQWVHLRRTKRVYWKRERQAGKREARTQADAE